MGRHRRVRGLLFARIFQNSIKCKAEISSFLENQLFKSRRVQTASANLEFERAALLRDQIMEVKSGTGLRKIEPKRKPVKYSRSGGQRRRSRV